jgi:hypothetical protein
VFQAHAAQVQTLQNEVESLRAQLVNLKGKSSQPTNHAQHVHGSGSREGPLRSFYGLSHNATSVCPSYFTTQEASVALKVSTTR